MIADKGYDSNSLVSALEREGITVVIPSRRNCKCQRDYARHIYKERHLIECFFNKLKHYRRVFARARKNSAELPQFYLFYSDSDLVTLKCQQNLVYTTQER